MAAFVLLPMLLLAMSSPSRGAVYCVCKDGVSDQLMQKAIDYACGSGADCSAILQNGACYNPNTVRNHCDYAVNSYFQRKSQVNDSCDFAGAAITSASVSTQTTGCVYPTSSQATTTSTGTSTTPTTNTTTGINPATPTYSLGPTSTTGTGFGLNSATTPFRQGAPAKSFIALVMPAMLSLLWGI